MSILLLISIFVAKNTYKIKPARSSWQVLLFHGKASLCGKRTDACAQREVISQMSRHLAVMPYCSSECDMWKWP